MKERRRRSLRRVIPSLSPSSHSPELRLHFEGVQCNAMHGSAMQCNTSQHSAIQYNTIQSEDDDDGGDDAYDDDAVWTSYILAILPTAYIEKGVRAEE